MRLWTGLSVLALLSSCVAPREPAPPPAPPPPAPLPPVPASEDWRDIPLTPGAWRYGAEVGGSAARFGLPGAAVFVVRCARGAGTVTLSREGTGAAAAPLIDITTSAGRRSFRGAPLVDRPGVAVALPARDPFLDGMAFSRGRFVVVATGLARLAIPAWPEFARVVEDCRG